MLRRNTATIYSVAMAADVSIATVSRVLQSSPLVAEPTRARVLDAVEQLGYLPLGAARSLAAGQHQAHGLVLPELTGPYYSELLMGFESRAAELGQSVVLLLAAGKRNLQHAVSELASGVDGLALLGSSVIPARIVEAVAAQRPVVLIAGDHRLGVEAIGTENVGSAKRLTAHVLGHGRRHLLFVGDPDAGPDGRDRHRGFVAAHRGHRLEPSEPVRISYREAEGRTFADRLAAGRVQADALVCANDELALAIVQRLQEHGLNVPADVAVVGWDDVMAARYIRPGLTTVRQPVHELGALAAERLHARVSGDPPRPGGGLLPTTLVLRGSCGCLEQSSVTTRPRSKERTREERES